MAYAYDNRDRCIGIDLYDTVNSEWDDLADYTWLGNAVNKRVTTCDYPGATKPQFKTEYERDGILRVTRVVNEYITANMSDATYNNLGSFTYTYDEVGNPLTETSGYFLAARARADRVFTYDTLNRLTQAALGDSFDMSAPGPDETTTYAYDDLGNRSSHSYRDATAISYTHDDANRMTTVAGLTQSYDDAGNQTTGYSADRGTAYAYKYDHHNRLSEIWDATETNRKAAFTYDALGRRIVYVNDVLAETVQYYYDGVNEIAEFDASDTLLRRYTHGISYVDERLMMYDASTDRPYYYTLDRMYNVRRLVDRAGAIVERYMYDPYGRPYVTEMPCRVDMNNNCLYQSNDLSRVLNVQNGTIWDPRADLDDDGDVDQDDLDGYVARVTYWNQSDPTVRQAFSDVGNPYMFQGRPHFALDTTASATEATLMLNDHRARFCDPVIGRWITRDPLGYNTGNSIRANTFGMVGTVAAIAPLPRFDQQLYCFLDSNATSYLDPGGQDTLTFYCGSAFSSSGSYGTSDAHCDVSCEPSDGGALVEMGGTGPAYAGYNARRRAKGYPPYPIWEGPYPRVTDIIPNGHNGLADEDTSGKRPRGSSESPDGTCQCLQNKMAAYNSLGGFRYNAGDSNSNSAISCILKACGSSARPSGLGVVGWGSRPKRNCPHGDLLELCCDRVDCGNL